MLDLPKKLFVPRDTGACSLGANQVASKLKHHFKSQDIPIEVVRNGSRGLYWLEPLVEIETKLGRVAYGPIGIDDVDDFINKSCWEINTSHPKHLGLTEEISFLSKQQRVTFSKVGVIDPLSIDDYRHHHGFVGLKKALGLTPQDIVTAVSESGLRGRGGAAFPTGIKWQTVLDTNANQKYIICNADEGDSGTYSDRMLMEGDPFSLVEGMIIAGLAVNASRGYIYLREEYPLAHEVLNEALSIAKKSNSR